MKPNKRLIRFLRINFIVAKYGLKTGVLFLKLFLSGRFKTYINPRNWFHKQPVSQEKAPILSLKDFKPLLFKFSQVFTNSKKTSPDDIAQELNKLKNKVSSYVPPKSSVIINHETVKSSEDPVESIEPATFKTEDLGQQLKKLWNELNITQISGEEVAHHIGSLVNKGKDLKKQFSESVQQNITEYLQKELPSRTEMNDFFNEIDDLSLRVERLQAHVNQLMSHHEIN